MVNFTFVELQAILNKCVPEDAADALTEDNLDFTFLDLGYDSLVIAEFAVRLNDDYGLRIPDVELDGLETPAAVIAYVSQRIPVTR